MPQLSNISTALEIWWSRKYGPISLGSIEEIPGGWLSRAFKLSYEIPGKKSGILFLRTCKSKVGGYAYASDRLQTFAISHEMYTRAKGPVTSYGVFGIDKNGILADDILDMDLEYFHVQDFLKGVSLQKEIDTYRFQDNLSTTDLVRMASVGKMLAELHNSSIPSSTDTTDAVRRSQREVFANPQITLDVLSAYPNNHHFLGVETGKYRYLELMLRTVDNEAVLADTAPCVPLHGDFWGSNILIDDFGNPFLIDYSRIPYGDPAIDVGNFLGVLAFDALTYDKKSYFDAANEFLTSYLKHRNVNDSDILRRCVLVFFWIGIIRMYPPVFGNTPPEKLIVFDQYINQCYTSGTVTLNFPICE